MKKRSRGGRENCGRTRARRAGKDAENGCRERMWQPKRQPVTTPFFFMPSPSS